MTLEMRTPDKQFRKCYSSKEWNSSRLIPEKSKSKGEAGVGRWELGGGRWKWRPGSGRWMVGSEEWMVGGGGWGLGGGRWEMGGKKTKTRFSKKSCKTKQPMFLAGKKLCSPIENKFKSLNTDNKYLRKSQKVSLSSKNWFSLRISMRLLRYY